MEPPEQAQLQRIRDGLLTDRLRLREMALADLDFLAELLAHPEVMRYYPKCYSRPETQEWVERQLGRYANDGHGLWLQISSSGTKAWLFRYMIDGRARHMGLGPLHTVSLAEARTRARQTRQLILDGKDPIEVKYEARDARRSPGAMVFKEAAQRFIEVHDPTWRSARP